VLLLLVGVGIVAHVSGTRLRECAVATNSLGQVCARIRVDNRALRYCNIEVSSSERREITNVPMWSFCEQRIEVPLLSREELDSLTVTCFPETGSGCPGSICRAIRRWCGSQISYAIHPKNAFVLTNETIAPAHDAHEPTRPSGSSSSTHSAK
jgi:hypothetical protein